MYNQITNPYTKRKVYINTKLGKKILYNYLKQLGGRPSTEQYGQQPFGKPGILGNTEQVAALGTSNQSENKDRASVFFGQAVDISSMNPHPLGTLTRQASKLKDESKTGDIKMSDYVQGLHNESDESDDPVNQDESMGVESNLEGDPRVMKEKKKRVDRIREVTHCDDCFAGAMLTYGIINKEQYDELAKKYPKGITDDEIIAELRKIYDRDFFIEKFTTFDEAMELAKLEHGQVMPMILDPTQTSNITWKHAILVGKFNEDYILIDTQLSGKNETIYVGHDEIKKYLDNHFGGLTEFMFDIIQVRGSLIEQLDFLEINDESVWRTYGVPLTKDAEGVESPKAKASTEFPITYGIPDSDDSD